MSWHEPAWHPTATPFQIVFFYLKNGVLMRSHFAVMTAATLLMAGCSSKSVVQPWKDSVAPLPRFEGPVCLLPSSLPADTEYTLLGRAVANQQFYGGYADVKIALSEIARGVGADVVMDQKQRMKIGFFAWARPQVWGFAVRLKEPSTFDCTARGGTLYAGKNRLEPRESARPVDPKNNAYDACMARVLRISDVSQRTEAMSMCDGIK